jgi:hypothetical protein
MTHAIATVLISITRKEQYILHQLATRIKLLITWSSLPLSSCNQLPTRLTDNTQAYELLSTLNGLL